MHKRILDKLGPRGWKVAHAGRVLLWRIFRPRVYGVAALIRNQDGHILLIKASYLNVWHLPGGGIDGKESPADAMVRETQEEVGLTVRQFRHIETFEQKLYGATNTVSLFLVEDFEGKVQIDGREIVAVMWADPTCPPDEMTQATRRGFASLARIAYP